MSAYLYFVCEEMPKIKKANSALKQKEIMSILGKQWKNMDDKSKWTALAAESKETHAQAVLVWQAEQAQIKAEGGEEESDDVCFEQRTNQTTESR